MAAENICGDCRHWRAGQCFRFPPVVTLWPMDNQHPVLYAPGNWRPDVAATEPACGEFKQAERAA